MWTCPKCGAKVDPNFEVCWQCGTSPDGTEDPTFVPADQAGPLDDSGATSSEAPQSGVAAELVPCYQAFSLIEAKFLADQLTERGITAVCDTHDMQDALGSWTGNPRVYCH